MPKTLLRIGANDQSLAYVYGRETKADSDIAKVLTLDEARRIASNIAKLATLLGKGWVYGREIVKFVTCDSSSLL